MKPPFPTREETFDAFARHVSRGKADTFRAVGMEVVMGERQGSSFQDAFDGRRLYNCHCNGGVFNLGHRHPRVLSAVRDALETLDVGNHHFVSGMRAELARRLGETTGGRLPTAVFGVSGGESIDLAIKLARAHRGRRTIVSAHGGYHGHTGLALAAGDPRYRDAFGPNLPSFAQVPFDDLEAMERAIDDETAAVLLEPIPATLGMPIPRAGYLAGVQRLCRERGALLIVDEVQTGLGRTGRIWAYQHEEVEPDLLVTGKGLSGGLYPITATLATPGVHAFVDEHPFVHISTFGGSEVGCAAALAVLDVVESEGFLPRVHELAGRFARGLAGLPFTLRQRGLFMGLKLEEEGAGLFAARRLHDEGVFVLFANNDTSVVQFLPPLVVTDGEADDIVSRVRRAFS